MSAHLSDELPRLLTGEASRDAVLDAAAHLRTCVDCQQELVSAVVAHASLSSAHRFAPEVVAPRPAPAVAEPTPLPDLSAVFAQVRKEVAEADPKGDRRDGPGRSRVPRHETSRSTRERRPSRRVGLIAAAAAAVLVAGTATTTALITHDSPQSSTAQGRNVALSAYDTGHSGATATIDGGSIALDARSLPKNAGTRYEVWLTDAKRTRMQPIGWVGNDGWAKVTVPMNLMNEYQDLEVSVQHVGQSDYAYSGTSVLRGSLQ